MSNPIIAAKSVDEKGRCCGRKPVVYRRPPHLFCCRCDAAFDAMTGRQIPNWAYAWHDDNSFVLLTSRALSSKERA
jgi:hypothetical protein